MYRVGSFSNALSSMAPPGHSSLYVELSDRTTPPEQLVPRVVEGLVAMGVIERAEQVLFAEPRYVPEAYVIYDEAYAEARATSGEVCAGRLSSSSRLHSRQQRPARTRPARPAPATATPRGRRALIRSQPLTSREHPF